MPWQRSAREKHLSGPSVVIEESRIVTRLLVGHGRIARRRVTALQRTNTVVKLIPPRLEDLATSKLTTNSAKVALQKAELVPDLFQSFFTARTLLLKCLHPPVEAAAALEWRGPSGWHAGSQRGKPGGGSTNFVSQVRVRLHGLSPTVLQTSARLALLLQ